MDAKLLYSILAVGYDNDVISTAPMSYSGRAMYGDRCIAIAANEPADLMKLAFWAGQAYGEQFDAEDMFRGMRSDSFGRGLVYYWPNHKWDESTMEEGA